MFVWVGGLGGSYGVEGFCLIIPAPVDSLWGLRVEKDGELKEGKKGGCCLCVFSSFFPPRPRHIPLRAPLSSKLDSLGTDSHASPPSVDNQFSFLKSPPRVRELWAPALILASGKKQRSQGISPPSALASPGETWFDLESSGNLSEQSY